MARILITSGPTRQYIDPVRYISNASSGRMGCCLVEAALKAGHEVVLVSGPVDIQYPFEAELFSVLTTDDMLEAATKLFPDCDGMIGVAAPCDYKPIEVADYKIRKTGEALELKLIETPDVVAFLGANKQSHQWTVGFALETDDARFRAITKLQKKNCDLVVLNGPTAINASDNEVEIIAPDGTTIQSIKGPKASVASQILATIEKRLISDPK